MNHCSVTHDLNRHLAAEDSAEELAGFREKLATDYRAKLLCGCGVKIGDWNYTFSEVRSNCDSLRGEELDRHMMLLVKGVPSATELFREFLGAELERVIEEMVDAKIDEIQGFGA